MLMCKCRQIVLVECQARRMKLFFDGGQGSVKTMQNVHASARIRFPFVDVRLDTRRPALVGVFLISIVDIARSLLVDVRHVAFLLLLYIRALLSLRRRKGQRAE